MVCGDIPARGVPIRQSRSVRDFSQKVSISTAKKMGSGRVMPKKWAAERLPVFSLLSGLLLLGQGLSPKYGIPVRETAEPLDHVMMVAGKLQRAAVARRFEQAKRQLLIFQIFTVLKRHVEE
jgi:hypothetical protein